MLGKTALGQSIVGSDQAFSTAGVGTVFQSFWKICTTFYLKNGISISSYIQQMLSSTVFVKNSSRANIDKPTCSN